MSAIKNVFLKPDSDNIVPTDSYNTNDQVTSFIFNEHHSLPINKQRELLPIRKHRNEILYCIEKYQVLILIGETGSGKSTQVPQYLYEFGWHTKGLIGVTEPRRISALTLANRVASERGELVGDSVGLVASFINQCTAQTKIKYMSENILLAELLQDPLLTQYAVIMVDEAHERSLLTDTILGLLKKIIKKRPSLKIIISSATIDAVLFQNFFNLKKSESEEPTSVVLSVEGRTHPVQMFYISKPCADYVKETVETIWKIHKKEPSGHILAFLTDQDECLVAMDLLKEYTDANNSEDLEVLPMYGSLSSHDQLKVFFTPAKGVQKVILATSIAETSITIPGIVNVIDCGFTKLRWFDTNISADSLMAVPISKEAAIQRAGRAGRVRLGKVYRLYTEEAYENFAARIPPEMRRTELSSTVLRLKALGIGNVLRFDFPSAPPAKNLLAALETLNALEALDQAGNLTKPIGYTLAELPFGPLYGKMLYASGQMGCSEEILTIIAMLQVKSVFSSPLSSKAQIKGRVAKRTFEVAEGDLITLLNVYEAFVRNGRTKEFCGTYYLIYRNLQSACQLREQLSNLVTKNFGIPLRSCKGNMEMVCKCIAAGFFINATYLHHSGVFRKINSGTEMFIHPSSCLYTVTQPQYVVFCEPLQTFKLFMKNVTVVKAEWLTEVAPHFYFKTTVKE